jgi:hypothetical protein
VAAPTSLEARQRRVDAFCAALGNGDLDAATAQLADDARIRVVTSAGDEQARLPAGLDLLCAATGDPAVGWGEQRRGDVHVAGPMFVVVFDHVANGESAQRVVLLRFDDGDLVSAATVYRFPL